MEKENFRLLTAEERKKVLDELKPEWTVGLEKIAFCEAQLDKDKKWEAKTAAICERSKAIAFETGKTEAKIECQAKLERIKRGIEEIFSVPMLIWDTQVIIDKKDWDNAQKKLEAIWKEELER